jgi:5,10-methylene-tetrahydrofolate dehydrogenase/methenyl tetrahydrofolate cyclohydrolase
MPKLILDGNSEASKLASDLARSGELSGKSLLIIQCDGRHEESVYVRLKREMGERLGVLASVVFAKDKQELVQMLMSANINEAIDGILVQLPIKDATKEA